MKNPKGAVGVLCALLMVYSLVGCMTPKMVDQRIADYIDTYDLFDTEELQELNESLQVNSEASQEILSQLSNAVEDIDRTYQQTLRSIEMVFSGYSDDITRLRDEYVQQAEEAFRTVKSSQEAVLKSIEIIFTSYKEESDTLTRSNLAELQDSYVDYNRKVETEFKQKMSLLNNQYIGAAIALENEAEDYLKEMKQLHSTIQILHAQYEKAISQTAGDVQRDREQALADIRKELTSMVNRVSRFVEEAETETNRMMQQERKNISMLVSGTTAQTEKTIDQALLDFNQKLDEGMELMREHMSDLELHIQQQRNVVTGFTNENEKQVRSLMKNLDDDIETALQEIEKEFRQIKLIEIGIEAKLSEQLEALEQEVAYVLEQYHGIRSILGSFSEL